MRLSIRIVVGMAAIGAPARALGHSPGMLEFEQQGVTYQGKLAARDDHSFWLLDRSGRLNELEFDKVTRFRRVSPRFQAHSAAEIRDALRQEFGGAYEVVGTGHFLVCAARGRAAHFAALFDDVYRTFYQYFSTRSVGLSKPEFPLVAIVFPDERSFLEYRRKDDLPPTPGLVGYYHALTNRVALFESPQRSASAGGNLFVLNPASHQFGRTFATTRHIGPGEFLPASRAATSKTFHTRAGSIQAGLRETIVHEVTHQVAFNTGLHSRLGGNPQWVVEGLATVFEADGIRNRNHAGSAATRINRDRYVWFLNFVRTRRPEKSLSDFLASDRMFRTATLDAYAQAWAFSFFLVETRPVEYARYLRAIAARDPLEVDSAERRLQDFRSAFGSDVDWLEVEFLRFIERLK